MGQETTPPELPIFGDVGTDISLELVFPKIEPVFSLDNKTLKLLGPLDRDKENLGHLIFQVSVRPPALFTQFVDRAIRLCCGEVDFFMYVSDYRFLAS